MSDQEKVSQDTEVIEETAAAEMAGEEEFKFVEDPTFDLDYKGECAYEVKVSVPAANEKKQAEEMFEELQHEATLPGFRPGRAPMALVQSKFSKAVKGDVIEKLVGAAFRKLVADNELKPIEYPDIDGLEEAKDKAADAPLEFTMKFEVTPRCELAEYKGIEVERPVLKIDDKAVDEAIDDMRNRFATYENVEKGKAEEGDQVIIDFEGKIDGEVFAGGSAENYPYILGSKRFFPEFEAALDGAQAGSEVTCDVEFPEDYGTPDIAGKTATFTIKINELKRRQKPALDDEFAKQAGYESLDEMKEKVSGELKEGAKAQSDRVAEGNAIEKIVEASTFELPKSLVESSANEYYNQEVRRLMGMRMPMSEIEAREEELRKQAKDDALKNIKAFVVVNEIGVAEDIEVTEADFEKEAEAIQQRTGMEMDAINRYLQLDEQRDSYESRIFRKKAMAAVMADVKVVEKEVTSEELDKENENADD